MVEPIDEPAGTAEREVAVVRGGLTRATWYELRIRAREVHRYFPEWADRVPQAGTALEADRNSYLAGGYAEEFGYLAQRGARAARPLIGDPERCLLWHAHVGGLHPGYPECATPQSREPHRLAEFEGHAGDEGRADNPDTALAEHAASDRLTRTREKRISLTERPRAEGPGSRRRLRLFF